MKTSSPETDAINRKPIKTYGNVGYAKLARLSKHAREMEHERDEWRQLAHDAYIIVACLKHYPDTDVWMTPWITRYLKLHKKEKHAKA